MLFMIECDKKKIRAVLKKCMIKKYVICLSLNVKIFKLHFLPFAVFPKTAEDSSFKNHNRECIVQKKKLFLFKNFCLFTSAIVSD